MARTPAPALGLTRGQDQDHLESAGEVEIETGVESDRLPTRVRLLRVATDPGRRQGLHLDVALLAVAEMTGRTKERDGRFPKTSTLTSMVR